MHNVYLVFKEMAYPYVTYNGCGGCMSNVILSFIERLRLPRGFFSPYFTTTFVYAFLISHIIVIYPDTSHPSFLIGCVLTELSRLLVRYRFY